MLTPPGYLVLPLAWGLPIFYVRFLARIFEKLILLKKKKKKSDKIHILMRNQEKCRLHFDNRDLNSVPTR
jgi:hypothetical protein